MTKIVTFEETLALVVASIQEERKVIIEDILEDIAKLRPEWVEDQYDTGYTDALNAVIDMVIDKYEED